MESEKRAKVVRWEVAMDDHALAGLLWFPEELSKHRGLKKKRVAADISPDVSNHVGEGCRSDRAAALSYLMQDFIMKLVTETNIIHNAH